MLIAACDRHYSLEVVQNPVRARMCGFGDKVREFTLAFPTVSSYQCLQYSGSTAVSTGGSLQDGS
jgi:hypothetical protein